MSSFLFASIDHASKHLNAKPDACWSVTFINNEAHSGRLTEIRNGTYMLEGDSGDIYYFDAHKVLYINPLL